MQFLIISSQSVRQTGTHLHHPAGPPELDQPVKPPVYLLHLDADHVPEAGQVLTGGDEGVLVAGDVLKIFQLIHCAATCRKSIF